MTFCELKNLLEKNNIPKNVILMSNSGWECGATEIHALYYSPSKNEIHLVQDGYDQLRTYDEDMLRNADEKAHDWILIS